MKVITLGEQNVRKNKTNEQHSYFNCNHLFVELTFEPASINDFKLSLSLFCVSDGRILVHSRRSDASWGLAGHSQEVNCLDSKNGLIVSGSRDRTVGVRTPECLVV